MNITNKIKIKNSKNSGISLSDQRKMVKMLLNADEIRLNNYLLGYRMQIKCLKCSDTIHSCFPEDYMTCKCDSLTINENKLSYELQEHENDCKYSEKLVHFKELKSKEAENDSKRSNKSRTKTRKRKK